MNTFGTDSQSNINSVVDEQWDVIFLCDRVQDLSHTDQLCGLARFVSVLDNADSALDRFTDDCWEIFVPQYSLRGIGDQIERIVHGHCVRNANFHDAKLTVLSAKTSRFTGDLQRIGDSKKDPVAGVTIPAWVS